MKKLRKLWHGDSVTSVTIRAIAFFAFQMALMCIVCATRATQDRPFEARLEQALPWWAMVTACFARAEHWNK